MEDLGIIKKGDGHKKSSNEDQNEDEYVNILSTVVKVKEAATNLIK